MIASILIIALILAAVYVASHDLSGSQLLGVVALFLIGVLLVAFPSIAAKLAELFGVGRGTDLILYLAIVGGIFVSANLYFRSRRAERQLIRVVREMAIMRGEINEGISGD
jgi:hypothetical protein